MVAGACKGNSSRNRQRHQRQQHAKAAAHTVASAACKGTSSVNRQQQQQHAKAPASAACQGNSTCKNSSMKNAAAVFKGSMQGQQQHANTAAHTVLQKHLQRQQHAKAVAACKDISSSSTLVCKAATHAVVTTHAKVAACKGSSITQRQQQQHAKAVTAAVCKGSSPCNGHSTCQGRSIPCTLGCSAQSWACLCLFLPQLAPNCISLFKCISACPGTHRFAPITQAGRQAGTRPGPAMSLIVILGFAEVGQMSVALDAVMTVTRQAGRQAGRQCSTHVRVDFGLFLNSPQLFLVCPQLFLPCQRYNMHLHTVIVYRMFYTVCVVTHSTAIPTSGSWGCN